MSYKILVVDDEADNLTVYAGLLRKAGYSVLTAAAPREGLDAAARSQPDLVLCDVSMPETDGISVCRQLKADKRTGHIPVILMSGVHKSESAQARGLEEGADDYLGKPFSAELLYAKVKAVLRRACPPTPAWETLKNDGIMMDLEARLVTRKGAPLALTRKEFDLLAVFLRKPGRVLSVPYLLETVWDYDPADYRDPHTVEVHVSSLRKKLGPKAGKRVVSVSGLGYRLDPD